MDFLVIDDDKTFRDATCLLIGGESHYAEGAATGQSGLAQLKEDKFDAVLRLPPAFTMRTPLLAAARAHSKQQKEAKALLDTYVAKPEVAVGYYLALAHLALGDKAEALHALEQDYDRRSSEVLFISVDPLLEGLRGEERFRSLIVHMNLAATQH